MVVAAVDPGREKSHAVHVAIDEDLPEQAVVATARLADELTARAIKFRPELILLGNGTTSRAAEETIRAALSDIPVAIVDEYRTTDEAKVAYWKAHPPTGWRRFLPTGMQVPPEPVDDFVAVILAQRYLMNKH